MADFEEKLESILNNPQAMSQIMSLAQSLGASSGPAEPPPADAAPASSDAGIPLDPRLLSGLTTLLSQYNRGDDEKAALLRALKPFVREQRYARLDRAIQITKLSRIARMALELFRSEEV